MLLRSSSDYNFIQICLYPNGIDAKGGVEKGIYYYLGDYYFKPQVGQIYTLEVTFVGPEIMVKLDGV